MPSGEKQAEKLPLTTSSIITESKGTYMGVDGMGILVVMFSFIGTIIILDNFTKNAFPVGVGVAAVVFFIMRHWMSGKPDNFLRDVILYPMRPKLFEHRPRDKRQTIIKKK